jgi:hypothetical protein
MKFIFPNLVGKIFLMEDKSNIKLFWVIGGVVLLGVAGATGYYVYNLQFKSADPVKNNRRIRVK